MKLTVKQGDRWYVAIGNGAKVKDVQVVSFSKETVLLREADEDLSKFGIINAGRETRYVFEKVTWVEKLRK